MLVHPSLLLLSKLRFLGGWRRLKRTLSSPKGILLALFALGFFAFLLVPRLLAGPPPPNVADAIKPFVTWFVHPVALLVLFVATVIGGGFKSPLAFSMPEVELLFPGPFSRRQLLVYKLTISVAGSMGIALLVPLFSGTHLPLWSPALFVGLWLTVTFEQWAAMLVILILAGLSARSRAALYAVAGLVVLAAALSVWRAGVFDPQLELVARFRALADSEVLRVASAPFAVFSRVMLAESVGALAVWGAAAVAMTLGVVWLILRLDANFLEASLAASQRRYEMVERAKRSGGLPTIGIGAKPRFTLPRLPRLFGAGTIAWRQSLDLMRGSGRLLFILPAFIGPFVALAVANDRATGPQTAVMIGMPIFIGFFISMIMPLGVRTDLDHIDLIKTLPLRSTAVVWGAVAAAVLYLTLLQWIATLAMSAVMARWTAAATLAILLAIPVNLLFVASDSVLVILYPSIRRVAPGDVLAGMRIMLVNLVKFLFAMAAAGVAALGALAAWLVWGDSLAAMGTGGSIVLFLEGIATVWVAGLLFEQFDPSRDPTDRQ
jgi:hypothetical protein